MAGVNLRIGVRNFDELRRLLRNGGESLLREPWRNMLSELGREGEGVAHSHAPRASGRLASSIRSTVPKAPAPTWVKFRATATRSSAHYPRYPYPRRLEYDARLHHKGWFIGALTQAMPPRMRAAFDKFASTIVHGWHT
jgi:hypothetical protein